MARCDAIITEVCSIFQEEGCSSSCILTRLLVSSTRETTCWIVTAKGGHGS